MTRSKFRQQVFEAVDETNSLGAIPPQSNGGTAITGAAIDRLGAASGLLMFEAAAASGSPTAVTAVLKIQDCDTSDGTYTDFVSLETTLSVLAAVAKQYMINLDGAKQYIKVYVALTYTDGTTPANVLSAKLVLGDYDVDPDATQEVLEAD